MRYEVTLNVNGQDYPVELDAHQSLLDAVRGPIGLTGSKEGCDDSECGACMMLLDGEPVNACSYLALQAADREITTVEGLAGDELHPLQRACPRRSSSAVEPSTSAKRTVTVPPGTERAASETSGGTSGRGTVTS